MSQENNAASRNSFAIGGPSGSGKSTVIRGLKNHFSGRVCESIGYTTRTPRKGEVDGVHYYFINPADLPTYRENGRYANFTFARDNWYWIDAVGIKELLQKIDNGVYLTVITQPAEFIERRRLFSGLRWIWLTAPSDKLYARLQTRGDSNIVASMSHNRLLESQNRSGLISLEVDTSRKPIGDIVKQIINFIEHFEEAT